MGGSAVSSANAGHLVFRRYLDVAKTTGALFVSAADAARPRQLTHAAAEA